MSDEPIERRAFIRWATAMLFAAHAPGFGGARPGGGVASPGRATPPAKMRFARIRLETARPEAMHAFYSRTLGLPVAGESGEAFTVRAGESEIEFVPASDDEPLYHFAFNIPENKFAQAKRWLASRSPLLLDADGGRDEIYFDTWDAHALYFRDPAGNIVELIARHTLPNAAPGEFDVGDLLGVSEIGLVILDRVAPARLLMDRLGLELYHGSLFFVGDEQGLFVLPQKGYRWMPDRTQPADAYPLRVQLRGHGRVRVDFGELPYEISSRSGDEE